jgi:hypothetical protein
MFGHHPVRNGGGLLPAAISPHSNISRSISLAEIVPASARVIASANSV